MRGLFHGSLDLRARIRCAQVYMQSAVMAQLQLLRLRARALLAVVLHTDSKLRPTISRAVSHSFVTPA